MTTRILIATLLLLVVCGGCRVPVIDRGRNIIDGVPVLGSDVCCPPERHPAAGCKFGACDRSRYGPRPIVGDSLCDKVTRWHPGPDCDGRWLVLERIIGRRRVHHCLPLVGALGWKCGCRPGSYTPPRTAADDAFAIRHATVFFSLAKSTTRDDLRIRGEDIIAFDGHQLARYFDGSDVGLGRLEIDGFALLSENQILVSFSDEFTVDAEHALPGLSGSVDDSDILLFQAKQLGEVTRGTFSVYVDGSDVGLDGDDADIDAVTVLNDGRLVLSTVGDVKIGDLAARDEDLLVFQPQTLGSETRGDWDLYLDGSDIRLATKASEDVDAVAVDGEGRVYLSTRGDFDVDDIRGSGADVFAFVPEQTGSQTEGAFETVLYLDGRALDLSDNELTGVALPLPPPAN